MISDRISTLEVICKIGLFKCFLFLLFVHLSRNGFVPYILLNIILLVHELYEIGWVHIWFQLLKHLFKLWIVLVLSLVLINTHLFFHLIVVIRHEITHFVHYLVFALGLDCLLIILQLSREQISLRILECNGLLFSLCLVGKARNLVKILASTILDLVGIDEPDIILVISEELNMHLKDFDLTDLL